MPRKQKRQEPERDKRYHDTELLLWRYRDVRWCLEAEKARSERSFERMTGSSVEDYLDSLYCAGVDFSGSRLEQRAIELKKSSEMLSILDSAIDTMRKNHRCGEDYYWVLFFTFLSTREYSLEEILANLEAHLKDVSPRTYYRRRHEAVHLISGLLWGFAEKKTEDLLEEALANNATTPEHSGSGKNLAEKRP